MARIAWTLTEQVPAGRLLTYDTDRFPFAAWLAAEVFKVQRLDDLHVDWQRYKQRKGLPDGLGYGDNLLLRSLMQKLPDHSPFYRLYHAFTRRVIAPEFGHKISYSSHPKMRVHLAGTPTVSKWHRDAEVTNRDDQMNVWLPFTDTYDSNTLWIETEYGRQDYKPVTVRYGQALVFDGGYLTHGTVANNTHKTRVSADFRFAILGPSLPDLARVIFNRRPRTWSE
jgi:hypothetical protein